MGIAAGRLLSGRYRLVRPIGVGSQASVWVAEHLALSNEVAVKLIDPALAQKEDMRERFRREATAAAQLRSAHVVQILDHGIDGDQPFIVMELLEGEDLYDRLRHRGRLTPYETSKIVTQVARALTRAHAAGIVHRDLKPENVFLVQNDDDEVVKVLDFGIAKVTREAKGGDVKDPKQRTSIGELLGTPHYMSPEQVKGLAEIDHRADLWALGVMAYQCVTGQLPFDSDGVGDLLIQIATAEPPVPSHVAPDVAGPAFDAWFEKACTRALAGRFQSARELAEALARAVGISPEAARGPASVPKADLEGDGPPSRREPARPAAPPVVVKELPPEPPKEQRAPLDSEAAARDGAGAEPMPLLRKRPDAHGPDSKSAPVSAAPATKPRPSHPRPAIVLVGQDDDDVEEAPKPSKPRLVIATPEPSSPSPIPPRAAPPPPPRGAPPPPARAVEPPTPVAAPPPPPVRAAAPAAPPPARPLAPPPAPALSPRSVPELDPGRARTATATGLASTMTEPPPPELDGSRRQRAGKMLGLAVLAGAIVLTAVVVRSQIVGGADDPVDTPPRAAPPRTAAPAASASATSTTTTSSAPPASTAIDVADAGMRAIDPGARAERDAGRPAPWPSSTAAGTPTAKPQAPKPRGTKPAAASGGDDAVIEVPDAPE
jgi:serine/threonine-protein kinase